MLTPRPRPEISPAPRPKQELYRSSCLGEPNSAAAHELLHTHYTDRAAATQPAYSATQRENAPEPACVAAALHAESAKDPGPQGWRTQR
jgi:hypothetical protein